MILTLNDKLEESKHYKPSEKKAIANRLQYKNGEFSVKTDPQELFYVEDNIDGEYSHKNYMEYLLAVWDSHWGIVVSPDIIWYTLQCELTNLVCKNVESYRDLFITSKEKQEITVQSGSLTVMPLESLMAKLKEKVPSNVEAFLPEFSTSTKRSIMARYAAFCDMVSPYYEYAMFLCGFPAINVLGDASDWIKLKSSWHNVGKLFKKHQNYVNKVDNILEQICDSLSNVSFWKKMFVLEKCGSGHQYETYGWLTDLFKDEVRYPEIYPSHISIVSYKQLDTNKNYEMKQGLISSKKEGAFLIPDFAYIVYEKKEALQR